MTMADKNLGKHLIESYARIDESARITGIALIPRISRNNNLYTKKELERFHNIRVPLNWEHDPSKPIGTVTFYYNQETEQVYYEGMIEDDAAAVLAKNKTLFTSIEANPVNVQHICNSPGDCFNMPMGLTPTALALTETPGVPETSVHVIESTNEQPILAEITSERLLKEIDIQLRECFHDHKLEQRYAPNQTNLQNEQHVEELVKASTDGAVGSVSAIDDCLNASISKISRDHPSMPHDQVVARAITSCANSETIQHLKMAMEYFCNDCGRLHLPDVKSEIESFDFTPDNNFRTLFVNEADFDAFTHSSEFVGNVRYDHDSGDMKIILSGKEYNFCKVPARKFEAFRGATSKGSYFNREIKGQHDC